MKYQQVDFDNDTKGLLQKQQDLGNETADQIVARNTAGMDQKAQSFFDASQALKPEKNKALALNPMADDLDQALQARANRNYMDQSGVSKIRMKLKAGDEVLKNQARAAGAVDAISSKKIKAYSQQLKNNAAKQQARAQMFGSILGAAGSVGGAVLAKPSGGSGGAAPAAGGK